MLNIPTDFTLFRILGCSVLNLEKSAKPRKSTQDLDAPGKIKNTLFTNQVTTVFLISPCTPISCASFSRSTDFSRLNQPTSHCTSYSARLPWGFVLMVNYYTDTAAHQSVWGEAFATFSQRHFDMVFAVQSEYGLKYRVAQFLEWPALSLGAEIRDW